LAKGKAPAFQFYPMDFILDTMGWPAEHVGAHIRLMSYQWINGGVPDDLQVIQDITGLRGKRLRDFTALLERKYPVGESGERHNGRLERSRMEKQEFQEACIRAGKASAAQRALNQRTNGKANGTSTLQSSSSTSSQKLTPKANGATRLPHDFKVTPDHRYWALERGLPSPDDHIEHFREFWLSNGKKKLDWNATFRVWLINSKTKYGATNGRKAQVNQDQQRDDFRQMAAAIDGESSLETAVPKQRLLAHAGGKARSDGGLVRLAARIGRARFTEGLMEAFLHTTFIPSCEDIEKYAPAEAENAEMYNPFRNWKRRKIQ
jgi:uncharacterized protein YdaU (DUF1376 family)